MESPSIFNPRRGNQLIMIWMTSSGIWAVGPQQGRPRSGGESVWCNLCRGERSTWILHFALSNPQNTFRDKAHFEPRLYNIHKGTFQKLLSGFCPLRGGLVPPNSVKEKNLLFSHWFSVKGGGGYPPIPLRKIPLKSSFFWSKNSIFLPFFIHL